MLTPPARSPADFGDICRHTTRGSQRTRHQTCRHEHFSHSLIHSLTELSVRDSLGSQVFIRTQPPKKVLPGGTLLVSHDRKPGSEGWKRLNGKGENKTETRALNSFSAVVETPADGKSRGARLTNQRGAHHNSYKCDNSDERRFVEKKLIAARCT